MIVELERQAAIDRRHRARRRAASPTRPTCSRSTPRSRRRAPASTARASRWSPTRSARSPRPREKSASEIQELIGKIQRRRQGDRRRHQPLGRGGAGRGREGQGTSPSSSRASAATWPRSLAGAERDRRRPRSNPRQAAVRGAEGLRGHRRRRGGAVVGLRGGAARPSSSRPPRCRRATRPPRSSSELADELKNTTDIGKSAEEVASAAEELSSAVEEINRAAAQIMTALEQINRGAQQQSAAAQQSSAAVTQIEKGAQSSQDRAKAALERRRRHHRAAAGQRRRVDELIAGVDAIARGRPTTNARARSTALEQVSRKIDKIVDAITTVSIQTNMLAVNGSIEAARAGEFGKGFMVVSTDIRNLARDSSENAERIKDLVKAIQDQIVVVRRDLEEISAGRDSEVEKNKVITANLSTMVADDMVVVVDGNRDILTGADEIAADARRGQEGRRADRRRRAAGRHRFRRGRSRPPRSRPRAPRSSPPRSRRSPRSPTSCRTELIGTPRQLRRSADHVHQIDCRRAGGRGRILGHDRQFVTFHVDRETFAVPLAEVQEIIRLPEMVEVPLSPRSLAGLANLRGNVLPVISLRRVFNLPDAEHDDATRVVVINQGTPVGFVVDRMASVVTGELQRDRENRRPCRRRWRTDLVCRHDQAPERHDHDPGARPPDAAGQTRCPQGDGPAARASGPWSVATPARSPPTKSSSSRSASPARNMPCRSSRSRRSSRCRRRSARCPTADDSVLGVMTLRKPPAAAGQPAPDVRPADAAELGEQCRIVVVSLSQRAMTPCGRHRHRHGEGGAAGAAQHRRSAAGASVERRVAARGRDRSAASRAASAWSRSCSAERLFTNATIQDAFRSTEIRDQGETMTRSRRRCQAAAEEEEQFVVFRLADEEYGVPIDAVQEIVRVPEQLTRVPKIGRRSSRAWSICAARCCR